MNRNRMLLIAVVALLLSAGVTFLVYRVLQARLQPAQVTTKIVVAAKKIELGTLIKKEDIKLVDWPKATPLEGSFSDTEQVIDRGIMSQLQINEPLLESKLAPKEAGAGLMAVIPEGMRALSIQVNSIIGVSGFVLPGSRVDLILTAVPPKDVKGAKNDEMGSKIILENLEVLAAGQNVQRDVNGKPQTVQDVTLLLTPDQAQRVALATGDGRIQLALRSPLDKDSAEPPLVIRSALYENTGSENPSKPATAETRSTGRVSAAARRPPAPARKIAPPPPPTLVPQSRLVVVELIQGTKRSENSFEDANPESEDPSTQSKGQINED